MKKLFYLLALFLFFFLYSANADNVKRILLEQHTGAWCGWCVDGSYVMDNILKLYPDRVIGVKVHNGDSMAIADGATIESTLSCPGFPSAMIDRKDFSGAKFVYRDTWQTHIEDMLDESAKVSVDLYYQIDEDSRELTATITTTPLENISGNLTFNVLICEDSVSGKGKGWDQHNYLSGRSGYENNPYYNEPSVIVGYEHVKVVRAFLGGPFGLVGELSETPYNIGTPYTHEFTFTLPDNWNINHLFLVGLIAKSPDDGYEILNSCYGIQGTPRPPIMNLTADNPEEKASVISTGYTIMKYYTLENIDSIEHTFNVQLNVSERTPKDWQINFHRSKLIKQKSDKSQDNQIVLSSGKKANFSIAVTAGATLGFADVKMLISCVDDPKAPKSTSNYTVASDDIEYFNVIKSSEEENSIMPLVNTKDKYIKIGGKEFTALGDKFTKLKTVVWDVGIKDNIPANAAPTLNALIEKGINLFLIGANIFPSLNKAGALSNWGIEYIGYSSDGYKPGIEPPYFTMLKGFEGDALTKKFTGYGFPTMREAPYIHVVEITDTLNVAPCICFSNNQKIYNDPENPTNTISVAGKDAICGLHFQTGNSKIVIYGIRPTDLSKEEQRENFINNPFKWFKGLIDVDDNINNKGFGLSISPNPIYDRANIHFSIVGNSTQKIKISLFNSLGQEVKVIVNKVMEKGNYIQSFDNPEISSGLYYLVLTSNTERISIPIIKF